MGGEPRTTRRVARAVASALVAAMLTLTILFLIQDDSAPTESPCRNMTLTQAEWQIEGCSPVPRPLPGRYLEFLRRSVTLDFGPEPGTGRPVSSEIASAAGKSFLLLAIGLLFALVFSRFTATAAVRRPGALLDRAVTGSALGIGAIPFQWFAQIAFWFMVLVVPGHLFPVGGYETAGAGYRGLAQAADVVHHLVVPGLAVGLMLWGIQHTFLRSLELEALGGNGASLNARRRAARTSRTPMIRRSLVTLGYAITAVLAVEWLFSYPGLGTLLRAALDEQYGPVLLGVAVVTSVPVAAIAAAATQLRSHPEPVEKKGSPGNGEAEVGTAKRPRRSLVWGIVVLGTYLACVFVGTTLIGSTQSLDSTATEADQPILAPPGWHCSQSEISTTIDPVTGELATSEDCTAAQRKLYPMGTDIAGRSVLAVSLWEARGTTLDALVALIVALVLAAGAALVCRLPSKAIRRTLLWLTAYTDSLPAAVIIVFAMFTGFASHGGFRLALGVLLWGSLARSAIANDPRPTRAEVLAALAATTAMIYFMISVTVDGIGGSGAFAFATDNGAVSGGQWWWIFFPMLFVVWPILGARLIWFGLTPWAGRRRRPAPSQAEPAGLE